MNSPQHSHAIQSAFQFFGWPVAKFHDRTLPDGSTICWYESDDGYIMSQINLSPLVHMGVFALRYRLCCAWIRLPVPENDAGQSRVWASLRGLLHYDNFSTLNGRRNYRIHHPECNNYSWKRIREIGPPFLPDFSVE